MSIAHHSIDHYPIRNVPVTRPFVWLREGWEDLMHHRAASLSYGLLISFMGALILAYGRHPFFIAAATTGFLLIGPIMTAGLCELSRCRDQGETANFQSSLSALQRIRKPLWDFSFTLMLIAGTWLAVSAFFLHGVTGNAAPGMASSVWGDVMRQLNTTQLTAYIVIGSVLAALVFTLSVVTVPMIVDRHVDSYSALRMSRRITVRDLPAMLVWAALIAVLVAVGFATWLLGMVVIFPLLGHASWRAYRELVEH